MPSDDDDLNAAAREIIDANLYMVLATADEDGRPWATPVYFAPAGYREFYWVSRPGTRHSRNIAVRPDVSAVVFDSRVAISTGQGVYLSAVAERLDGADSERGIEVFSRRSLGHGGTPWTTDDVRPPARLRLYRATASEVSILDKRPDPVEGRYDRRTIVDP
jgi:uncharacterized protein YhbP (UPF0306 family)